MAVGEHIRDADFLARTFQELVESEQEFPIKVKGAKTLPYTSVMVKCEPGAKAFVLRLFRPLPAALAKGAWFELVFASGDTRYEGNIAFQGQTGYLQYRFEWPQFLASSDRRIWKRYGFRPRENVHVTAQDMEIPCHGLSGPLTNLSMGGLCFRVDRMVRLDDGMPIRPNGGFMEKGKAFSPIKIHDLTKSEPLEVRGVVARVRESDSEVLLGIRFTAMSDRVRDLLGMALEARDRRTAPASGTTGTFARAEGPTGSGEIRPTTEAEATPEPVDAVPGLDTLRRLDRRTTRVLVVAPEGDSRTALLEKLHGLGFWRLDLAGDLFAAHNHVEVAGPVPFRLLVVDLEPSIHEGLDPVGAIRRFDPLLRSFGDLPMAYATQNLDPLLLDLDQPNKASLATADTDPERPARVLDRLLGLPVEATGSFPLG
jgi:hypothetical protein